MKPTKGRGQGTMLVIATWDEAKERVGTQASAQDCIM